MAENINPEESFFWLKYNAPNGCRSGRLPKIQVTCVKAIVIHWHQNICQVYREIKCPIIFFSSFPAYTYLRQSFVAEGKKEFSLCFTSLY